MREHGGFLPIPSFFFPVSSSAHSDFWEGKRKREKEISFCEAAFMDSPLLTKSKAFALRIIKVCNEVKKLLIASVHTAKTNMK
jgi:hypothetical protein